MDEEVKSTSWSRPPVREIALGLAIEHWNGSVQLAQTVVSTAETFLTFLLADEAAAKAREEANARFAGSGLVVNITGLPTRDAAAIADELEWIARTARTARRHDDDTDTDDGDDFLGAPV